MPEIDSNIVTLEMWQSYLKIIGLVLGLSAVIAGAGVYYLERVISTQKRVIATHKERDIQDALTNIENHKGVGVVGLLIRTVSSATIEIKARHLTLFSDDNKPYPYHNVNRQIDLQESISKYAHLKVVPDEFYLYLIGDANGKVSATVSTDCTNYSPQPPYEYSRVVSYFKYISYEKAIAPFFQNGNEVTFVNPNIFATGKWSYMVHVLQENNFDQCLTSKIKYKFSSLKEHGKVTVSSGDRLQSQVVLLNNVDPSGYYGIAELINTSPYIYFKVHSEEMPVSISIVSYTIDF